MESTAERRAALVVDDEATIREIAAAALRTIGFDPIEAATGEQAMRELERSKDDVVLALVDWSMPGLSGIELVRAVAAIAPRAAIVVTSGLAEDEIERQIHDLANVHLLPKPWRRADLIALARTLGSAAV